MLKELMAGSRMVGFYPNLARALGGAKAGLFFCQLSYWMGDAEEVHRNEAQFEQATALTDNEQAGARQILLAKNAISVERRGAPPRLFYRINWDVVEKLLSTLGINSLKSGITPENQESIPEIPELSIPKDIRKEKREKKKTICNFPENFTLTEELLIYAQGQGVEDPSEQFELFKLHHKKKGNQFADWSAAFQYWCRQNKKYREQDTGGLTVRDRELIAQRDRELTLLYGEAHD